MQAHRAKEAVWSSPFEQVQVEYCTCFIKTCLRILLSLPNSILQKTKELTVEI